MSWAKRPASASTASRQACSAVTCLVRDRMKRGADELVVVEEKKVGVEDLGLALSGGTGDVISGRASSARTASNAACSRSVSAAGVLRSRFERSRACPSSEILGPMPKPGEAAVGPASRVADRTGGAHGFVEVPSYQGGDCRQGFAIDDRRH